MVALSISVLFLAVILLSVRSTSPARSLTAPAELIPAEWETVAMPRYSFGYPGTWDLERTGNDFTFTDSNGHTVVALRDITANRTATLTELATPPSLSTADFSFADQPARRYIFPDRDVYIIAVGKRAYRLETYGQDPNTDLFLATIRFF